MNERVPFDSKFSKKELDFISSIMVATGMTMLAVAIRLATHRKGRG